MEDIRFKIESGVYGQNEQLPSLRKLAGIYDATPVTIKKSLAILEEKGYIYVIDRKGFFVNVPNYKNYTMIFQEQKSLNEYNRTELCDIAYIDPLKVSEYFQMPLPQNIKCIKMCRKFYNKLLPVGIDYKYLIVSSRGSFGVNNPESFRNMMDLVINNYDISKALTVSVMPDNSEFRQAFFLEEDDPVYDIRTVYTAVDSRIVALSATFIPCEDLQLRMEY